MKGIVIVPHHAPEVSPADLRRVEALAAELREELPELQRDAQFAPHRPSALVDGRSLVLDDLGEIRWGQEDHDLSHYQDRARMRAADGDLVVTHAPPPAGYETYCRDWLGLGSVEWLHPRSESPHLSLACWRDDGVRKILTHTLRAGRLQYLHPHMGTFSTWELATLLHGDAGRPLHVVGPLPEISLWVNNKAGFARTVERLFGDEALPPTETAGNLAWLSEHVRDMSEKADRIVLKLPNSAGGGGNLVLETEPFRGASLHAVREKLQEELWDFPEHGETCLLVSAWESPVLAAPSAQLWIPPPEQGPPLVEGLFEQVITGGTVFAGCRPARLPAALERLMVDRTWLLGLLYQQLGYVGRCSFDALLVGAGPDRCRLELIECNGRWGGTSLPMNLVNRLFGDWTRQPYATREWVMPGLDRLAFADLLEWFEPELYDVRTGKGTLIFFNPTSLQGASRIGVIVLGESHEQVARRIGREFLAQLRECLARCGAPTATSKER